MELAKGLEDWMLADYGATKKQLELVPRGITDLEEMGSRVVSVHALFFVRLVAGLIVDAVGVEGNGLI